MQRFKVPATSRASFAFYNTWRKSMRWWLDPERAESVFVNDCFKTTLSGSHPDHNKKPRNWGTLADATHKSEGLNPLCGDHITLTLKLDGDVVDAINVQGESCAICKASASMMTTMVKGKTCADAEQMVQEFRDMATGKLDPAQPHHLGGLPCSRACAICRAASNARSCRGTRCMRR